MNSLTNLRFWTKAFLAAPLIVLGLYIYMGLPSRFIFPEGSMDTLQPWHPGFLGWYDLVLGFCLVIGTLALRVHVPLHDLAVGGFVLAAIVASVAGSDWGFSWELLVDDIAYWFRFFAPFVAFVALVNRLGEKAAETVLVGMAAVLMFTSLFVFRLQYGTLHRFYSSGMTVGSFSQAMLVLFVIAMVRANGPLMLVSALFLILTFSRTALALWVGCLTYYFLSRAGLSIAKRLVYSVLIILMSGVAVYFLMRNPEFRFVIEDRLNPDDIATFNKRFVIWEYGADLVMADRVPLTGIGFHFTPSVLMDYMIFSPTEGNLLYFPSFHSIILEYGVGLGILAVPIFAGVLWRIWLTWRFGCYLPFLIFILFFVSQSIDFTFYHPKEVVMWGAFLGVAEGEWIRFRRLERSRAGRSVRRTSVPQALAVPALGSAASETGA